MFCWTNTVIPFKTIISPFEVYSKFKQTLKIFSKFEIQGPLSPTLGGDNQ